MIENRSGFTLVELLIVVLIVGILAAIALPQYRQSVMRARAAEAVNIIGTLERAYTACIASKRVLNPGCTATELGVSVSDSDTWAYHVYNVDTGSCNGVSGVANKMRICARPKIGDSLPVLSGSLNGDRWTNHCKGNTTEATSICSSLISAGYGAI